MSQLFILNIKNESTKEINLKGENIDSCIEGSIDVPSSLKIGEESVWKNMEPQVKWDCKNGQYKITVTPTPAEAGTTTGEVVLDFNKESTAQFGYGKVSINSQTNAVITKSKFFSTELQATVSNDNDSGDECTIGTLIFKTTELTPPQS